MCKKQTEVREGRRVAPATKSRSRQLAILDRLTANTETLLAYLDNEFNFLWVNDAYVQRSGHTKDELIGHNHFEFFPDEENQAIFERVRATGESYHTREKPFVYPEHPEWGVTYWDWTLVPITGDDGIDGFSFSLVDVTDKVRVTEDLARAKREAEIVLTRAYERERAIADTLQRAMIPDVRLRPPGFGIAGAYQPALAEAAVGGDFYDAFDLGDGRIALAMGDVSGKGVEAAVHTAMAKYTLRAYAHEDARPAAVLTRLNNAVHAFSADEIFVTLFYCLLNTTDGGAVYANGGHEQPVLYSCQTGLDTRLDVTGPGIGLMPSCRYGEIDFRLSPGDVLLMYTDGVTDARVGDDLFGVERVTRELLANIEATEEEIIHAVFEAALRHAQRHLKDDAALLVVKAHHRE